MTKLARRSILLAPLVLACRRRSKIDPAIAAWLGEPGDPPMPRIVAKLSRRSTKADVTAAFPGTEDWGANSMRVRTTAAPGLEWLEFQFPDTLYCVTVVYSPAASTPELWSGLRAALTARYGAPKNQDGTMYAAEGLGVVTAYEAESPFSFHRVKFFL